jgi:hypothetical protein
VTQPTAAAPPGRIRAASSFTCDAAGGPCGGDDRRSVAGAAASQLLHFTVASDGHCSIDAHQ